VVNEVKINPEHLQKKAYVYVRQSTMRQVVENSESTKRQYQLREKAVGLGWAIERIVVIDEDLGCSGSSAQWRDGFQYLMAEVSMAKAGAIFSIEVSRLARSSSDWHRLLEICAMTETLIVDEDGIYDPRHFNDRFLLGMLW
jgi:DNA invertase Pin-like site-specific DNA recombinase